MKHESDGDTNCNWRTQHSHQRIGTRTERLRNKRLSRDHPNYSIIKTSRNTEKSPGDLRRLALTQTPVGNPRLTMEEKNSQKSKIWDFDIHTDHLILARRPDLIIINNKKKKRIRKIVDFAVPADHRIKLKESENKDKYLDLARELKKLWNMRVTIVPIVIGAFGPVTKGLLKGLEDSEVGGRVETIQMTALLKTTTILRRVLETWGYLLLLKLQ